MHGIAHRIETDHHGRLTGAMAIRSDEEVQDRRCRRNAEFNMAVDAGVGRRAYAR